MTEPSIEYRKPLRWGELDPHRAASAGVGMWAWLAQRISALLILVLLVLHVTLTYRPVLQLLLLATVTFHAALGLRVILLDLALARVGWHRALVWGLMTLGAATVALVWFSSR